MGNTKPVAQDIVDTLLAARGVQTKQARAAFLTPEYASDDPFLLPDMQQAVARIVAAHKQGETVAIYGDYDIDGLTATTLLLDAFHQFGIAKTLSHIPNRFIEGYGMSKEGIDALHAAGAALIVTVDCGSVSIDEVAYANSLGIDVIVTDHHTPGDTLPDAIAVVNAKREDNQYPFNDFAGVGVAFKLVQALQTKLNGMEPGQEKWLLDLVAFGTVCDIVSLTDENRMLVHYGLKVMKQTKRAGIKALAEVAGVDINKVRAMTLGFVFGPRLNAAGRLETAQHSLDLLVSDDHQAALPLAARLEGFNQDRRAKQAEMIAEAEKLAQDYIDDPVLVLSSPDWAEGIVGIVASKMVETFAKPSFMLAELGDETKGSGRSFGDFSIVAGIRASDTTLIKGGGHKYAGGVTMKSERIDDFRKAINEFHVQQKLEDQDKHLQHDADVTLETLMGLDLQLIDALAQLEPFGQDNPEPVFWLKGMTVTELKLIGSAKTHVKLALTDAEGHSIAGIAFGKAKTAPAVGEVISPLVRISDNEFRGNRTVQAQIIQF